MNRVIAIDGPSGSGKSTTAKAVGKRLGFIHVDSGALYRIMALAAVRSNIDCEDEIAVAALAARIKVEFRVLDGSVAYFIDGQTPGDELRTPRINAAVSPLSRVAAVRDKVTAWLRGMCELGDIVVEGRDIGSVVFPDSPARFYLIASADERAKRRHQEERRKGIAFRDEAEVKASLLRRDKIDSSRKNAPLKIPDGAFVIDSTTLSVDEVVELLISRLPANWKVI